MSCCISRFDSDWFALAASRDGEGKRTGTKDTCEKGTLLDVDALIFCRGSHGLTRSFIHKIHIRDGSPLLFLSLNLSGMSKSCVTYRACNAAIFRITLFEGDSKKRKKKTSTGSLSPTNRGGRLNDGITVIGPFIYFECNSGRPSLFPIGRYYQE